MRINMVGAFIRNAPFGTEIAFAKGMERRGHEVIRIDTSYPDQKWDQDADATLVFKWMEGDYWDKLAACKGVKIVYQPDDARFPHIREMLVRMRDHVDCLLTFDKFGVDLGRHLRYRDSEFMLLTADDELYSPGDVERDIDVSFVGSLTGGPNHASRMRMCRLVEEEARRRGWKTFFGETYFSGGPSPVDIYRRSKVVLNHATDIGQPFGTGYGLQCRHFEVGMTRAALVSNLILGPCQLPFSFFASDEDLIPAVEHELECWQFGADMLHNEVMERHRPEHRADQLVRFIERNS